MISSIFNSSTVPVLEQMAVFSEARHGLLAGNIANLDTPGYETRDLSVDHFQTKLKEAIAARNSPGEPVSPGVLSSHVGDPSDPLREVKESMKNILFHDKSDVGLEQQVTEIANNQFMHSMAVALMSHQFRQLEAAVSERV